MSCDSRERIWSSLFSPEIRWLLTRIRPLLHWHLASFACITTGSFLALLTPLILKWLIDGIIPQKRMSLLFFAVAVIFLAHEGRTALNSAGSYIMLTAAQKTGLQLRMTLLRHLNTLSADYYENTSPGAAMYPLKEPVEEISYFGSDLFPAILRIFLTTAFTLAAMLALSPMLTLVVVPLVPIFLTTRNYYRKRLVADADHVQCDRRASNDFLQEHISAVIPIQLLAREKRQERRAFRLLARTVSSQQQLNRTGIRFTICSSLAIATAMCAVIGYGGANVLKGTLSVGSLVAFYGFIAQLFDPLSGAAELYARTQKIFASIRQVQSVLQIKPTVANSPAACVITKPDNGQIDFSNVHFSYTPQKDLLSIPFLRFARGEHVAIAGDNGAGKSTLAKLIARLYDPLSGSIRISDIDARNIDLQSLREWICYVPRDPVLFDGTILSNLRFIRPRLSQGELDAAIQDVGLSALIARLPQGMQQRIGPGGCQLSGGERQRLALARALLQNPGVLILDEATSCLDASGEAKILQNLQLRLKTATFIVISHRTSTFSTFSRILVLSEGRISQDIRLDSLIERNAFSQECRI